MNNEELDELLVKIESWQPRHKLMARIVKLEWELGQEQSNRRSQQRESNHIEYMRKFHPNTRVGNDTY